MKTALEAAPAARGFRALANPARLEVFFHLVRAGERPAGRIARAVRMPAPTLSRHLAILREAGLVRCRRERRNVYCSVRGDAVTRLVRILTACC
ncbi:MAG TPA: metalloregulator ArsR/SmtB family transcription factor [Planctomycetota bacterium]|jgi:DNA-binding transcriptional ArsR family regulator|nr:metalloregulator ArsR/SmtB family transcription factor [Planctomycetota bacterium]